MFLESFYSWPNLDNFEVGAKFDLTRLKYNCAHLRLNNKKNKNKLSQNGPQKFFGLKFFGVKIFGGKHFLG